MWVNKLADAAANYGDVDSAAIVYSAASRTRHHLRPLRSQHLCGSFLRTARDADDMPGRPGDRAPLCDYLLPHHCHRGADQRADSEFSADVQLADSRPDRIAVAVADPVTDTAADVDADSVTDPTPDVGPDQLPDTRPDKRRAAASLLHLATAARKRCPPSAVRVREQCLRRLLGVPNVAHAVWTRCAPRGHGSVAIRPIQHLRSQRLGSRCLRWHAAKLSRLSGIVQRLGRSVQRGRT